MRLKVNPTRMELLKLKKRLVLAKRGHKLLKDKLEQLLQRFFSLMDNVKTLRKELEKKQLEAQKYMLRAKTNMSSNQVTEAILFPQLKTKISVDYVPLLNLRVPKYELNMEGDFFVYGISNTASYFDRALEKYQKIVPLIVKVAENEMTFRLLAEEIEKTRRRVNALEHILIPNIKETSCYISMKLEELARGDLNRLMQVKDIVRSH